MLAPLLVPDAHAAPLDDDARVGLGVCPGPGRMLNEMMPDMGAVGLDHMADIVVAKFSIHVVTPFGKRQWPRTGCRAGEQWSFPHFDVALIKGIQIGPKRVIRYTQMSGNKIQISARSLKNR